MFFKTQYTETEKQKELETVQRGTSNKNEDAQDANKWVIMLLARCVWLAGGQGLQAQDNTVEDHLAEDEVLGDDAVGVQDVNYVLFNDSNLNDLLNSSEDELYQFENIK